jgi:hypothetical protein
MPLNSLLQRWGLFAATVFLLFGVTLAYLQAGPAAELGVGMRYGFWMLTAAAAFMSWWLSQWLVVSSRERLSRTLLVISSFVATLLFVPASLVIDLFFGMPDEEAFWWSVIIKEWLASALPVFSSCMIASLPAWLSAPAGAAAERAGAVGSDGSKGSESSTKTAESPADGLLPLVVRGGVLRATADLQYVHLHSSEGVTTVPGPMRRVIERLSHGGMEVRRGEWIADRHVKQVKSVRGRWVVLLRDGQQVAVSRRRLPAVKKRWGSTRYA